MTHSRQAAFWGVVSAAYLLAAQMPAAAVDKYALLVGVTKYQHARMNDTRLDYPEADALAVGKLLKKSGYTVVTLAGKQATQAQVAAELEKLSQHGSDEGVVVIGLFGHGVQYGNDAYFGPYDTGVRIVKDSLGPGEPGR